MKKTGLFKILMILIIAVSLLTWFIPASYYSGTEMVDLGMYRVGFFDFFQFLFLTYEFQYFIQIVVLLLSIGGLYGVLAKTGVYRTIIEKIAKKLKGKEKIFLVVVAFILAAISSVLGFDLIIFLFIPALASIIILIGFDKVTAFLVTIVSTIVGMIGGTLSSSVVMQVNETIGSKFSTELYAKIGLFVMVFVVYILSTLLYVNNLKKVKSEDKVTPLLGEKKTTKVKSWPIYALFGLLFVIVVLSCTNWEGAFGVKIFTNLHKSITDFTIGDHKIFGYILGQVPAFGNWFYHEISTICIISAFVIGFIYKHKLSEIFGSFVEGAKVVIKPAILIVLAHVVVYIIGNTLIFGTIMSTFMELTKNLSVGITSFVLGLASTFFIDIIYLSNYVLPYMKGTFSDPTQINTLAILIQSIYGFVMLIAPTSTFLILGLEYFGISYKNWLKFSWKLLLEILAIIIIVALAVRYM